VDAAAAIPVRTLLLVSVAVILLAAVVPGASARDPVQAHAGARGAGFRVDLATPSDAPYQVTIKGGSAAQDHPAAGGARDGTSLHVAVTDTTTGTELFNADAHCRVRGHLAQNGVGAQVQLLCGERSGDAGVRLMVRGRGAVDPGSSGVVHLNAKAAGHVKAAGVSEGVRINVPLTGTLTRNVPA